MASYEGAGLTTRYYLHADERGSVVAVSDASGAAVGTSKYSVDGASASLASEFGFTGQLWLPSVQLYYFKARMYSPQLGRFMQRDPLGYAAGLNLYAYAGGDPVNARDPSGLALEELAVWGRRLVEVFWSTSPQLVDDYLPDNETSPNPQLVEQGGDGGSQAKQQPITCKTVLPNGQTVGDVVRAQQAQLQSVFDSTLQTVSGPLPAELGTFAAIAWPHGPIDFKNNFRGLASPTLLGKAGNFAYYSIGSGYVPTSIMDIGAGAYAVTSALRGQKPFSTLTGPMLSDQSAASVRTAALASNGCRK